MRVLFWEAVAAPGLGERLAAWAAGAVPGAEVYLSADDRVVLLVADPEGRAAVPPAPPGLLGRDGLAWRFRRLSPARADPD